MAFHGRPFKLTAYKQLNLLQAGANEKLNTRQLCDSLELDVSLSLGKRLLSCKTFLKFEKAPRAPVLSALNKKSATSSNKAWLL